MTRCLVVTAHPMRSSLTDHLAKRVVKAANAAGWDVTLRDLCAEGFDPRMGMNERASYYSGFKGEAKAEMVELAAVEVLILIFPTWWFGFPAVLKGWFDRVWAPGLAYDHAKDFGPMLPRLSGLRQVLVVTTMGAPAWVDWLIMRRPLRRVLQWGIIRPCAPKAKVTWRALYRAEGMDPRRLAGFANRIERDVATMARRLD